MPEPASTVVTALTSLSKDALKPVWGQLSVAVGLKKRADMQELHSAFDRLRMISEQAHDAKEAEELAKKHVGVRAANRMRDSVLLRQHRLEATTALALPEVATIASGDPLDEEWLNEWVYGAEEIIDETMRAIWARVLVIETAKPGTLSRRAVRELRLFSHEDAECLIFVSSRILHLAGHTCVSTGWYDPSPNTSDLERRADELGLIVERTTRLPYLPAEPGWAILAHCVDGSTLWAKRPVGSAYGYGAAAWTLTTLGYQLARIPDVKPDPEMIKYVTHQISEWPDWEWRLDPPSSPPDLPFQIPRQEPIQ